MNMGKGSKWRLSGCRDQEPEVMPTDDRARVLSEQHLLSFSFRNLHSYFVDVASELRHLDPPVEQDGARLRRLDLASKHS